MSPVTIQNPWKINKFNFASGEEFMNYVIESDIYADIVLKFFDFRNHSADELWSDIVTSVNQWLTTPQHELHNI